jgi:riboflavin kinase
MKLTGVVQDGEGKGAYFTSLPWVVGQIRAGAGFEPYPGTLNVRVRDADETAIESFLSRVDFELIPPNQEFCHATAKKVLIGGIPAVVVIPSDDVRIHGLRIVEVVSDRHLKTALNVEAGDQVEIDEPD